MRNSVSSCYQHVLAKNMNRHHLHGYTLPQRVGRLHFVLVQFVFARLDVNGDELVLVSRRQIGANVALDQRVPAAGERRCVVAAFANGDDVPPV